MAMSLSQSVKLIDIDELNCTICQESYDSICRNPRILTCGHTFCTACLKNILEEVEEEPLCPDCRVEIDADDVESLPICYLVKKIIDSVNEINKEILKAKSTEASVQNLASSFQATLSLNDRNKYGNSSQGQFLSNGMCKEHNAPKHMWCHTCQLWICGTCVFLKHQNQGTKQNRKCNVVLLSEASKDLKTVQRKKILSQKGILSRIDSRLKSLLIRNSGSSQKWQEIVTRKRNIEEDIDILDEALERIDSDASVVRKIHALDYVKNLLDAKCYPMTEEDILKGFWQLLLNEHNKLDLNMVNLHDVCLSVSCIVDGKRKLSKAWYWKDVILFYCVDDIEPPTPSPITFHLSDLFVPGLHTFLQLSNSGGFLGCIIFRLFENSQRARHFRMLCSGEAGPSYRGTRFFEEQGVYCQYLSGGDYEKNNGSGGRALFIFDEEDDDDGWEMERGTVCGPAINNPKRLGQFRIFHTVPNKRFSFAKGAFADVVEGLDLITSIAVNNEWPEVYISECGLLFYTSN